ncbi:MAG TPA: ATP-binding protein [Solirubrobacteraceae bacterium]|nr:ATP-binding protein [Solirubrobacteraceae bacterium]
MNAMEQTAHVRLELSSSAENVPVVRQVLSGLADATGLSSADLNDIGTAVTEACNNASLHAYGEDAGPLEVELLARQASVVVTVRDRGMGLALDGEAPVEFPSDVDGELAGIGVPSIKALTRSARWSAPPGGGTKVEMTFATGSLAWEDASTEHAFSGPVAGERSSLDGAIEVRMAPVSIARSVLPRLLRVMAARAHFPVQRDADVQRVGSVVLAADASGWASAGVQARVAAASDSLELAIGPMSNEDVSRLALAARAAEPRLRTSAELLDGGPQRLVLHVERSPITQRADSRSTSDEPT